VVGRGIVPLAMGADIAGSICIPASFNGLVGFRTIRQCYDKQGVFPLAGSLDTLAPIAHQSNRTTKFYIKLIKNQANLAFIVTLCKMKKCHAFHSW